MAKRASTSRAHAGQLALAAASEAVHRDQWDVLTPAHETTRYWGTLSTPERVSREYDQLPAKLLQKAEAAAVLHHADRRVRSLEQQVAVMMRELTAMSVQLRQVQRGALEREAFSIKQRKALADLVGDELCNDDEGPRGEAPELEPDVIRDLLALDD